MPATRYAFLDGPTPLAMAHRGGAIEHLENTMPAFEACVALGYRYIETDVRVTADGVLVVFHDATLERVTDQKGRVEHLSWDEVSRARIGGREPILRLEDLLGAWPDVRFNLDIKAAGVLAPLVRTVRTRGARTPAALMSRLNRTSGQAQSRSSSRRMGSRPPMRAVATSAQGSWSSRPVRSVTRSSVASWKTTRTPSAETRTSVSR